MPWKNGGGITTEIAVAPEGADFTSFVWRVSMAEIVADGPFSLLQGIDRSLAVVRGRGVNLELGDGRLFSLTCERHPVCFSGEEPMNAKLADGPTLDLNVMTRRRNCCHELRMVTLENSRSMTFSAHSCIQAMVLALTDNVVISGVGALGWSDAVSLQPGESITATAVGEAKLAWIVFRPR